MVFSSLLFLFRFLPAVLFLYYIVPPRFRNLVLFLVSLVFYAWGEPVYVLLMLVSILTSYIGGLGVHHFRKKGKDKAAAVFLVLAVAAGLSFLIVFKYAGFLADTVRDLTGTRPAVPELALPIGISFYTFQTISYIIDVWRGDAKVQKNVISYGAYVTMFPQLIAGPIVTYRTIDDQLRSRKETSQEFALGVNRFIIGLGKKVLLANNAGALWDRIKIQETSSLAPANAWLGVLAFTFQIYFDFSAYSDMAIGLGHMFGFSFLENFDYPYLSRSLTEFWRRWHISLGTWFRDYVYIPLGGSRKGLPRTLLNLTAVWLLTGIWHGAAWNFLFWGLYYLVLLIIEKLFLGRLIEKLPRFLQHIYCMIFVTFGWFLFSWGDVPSGTSFLLCLFGRTGTRFWDRQTLYLLYNNAVLLLLLAIGSTKPPKLLAGSVLDALNRHETVQIVMRCVFYAVIFLLSIAYLVDATYNPFLYFRF